MIDCIRYLGVVGPYAGTENGIIVRPKEARSKRAQPCEDMPFLGARQKELCNQVLILSYKNLVSRVWN